MSPLCKELDRYLTIRRSLGYDLGTAARILRRFIAFADQQGAEYITTDLFLRWQAAFGHANRQTWSARLRIVRIFAQWLHGIDPKHEVPPQPLFPSRYRRSRPYIYSDEEIRRIIEAAAELPSIHGIRGLTYATLFGLIAATGLRVSEAISLDDSDVDLDTGVLRIRRGKLGKSRLIPVSSSTSAQLLTYAKERDRLLGSRSQSFFVSDQGIRPNDCSTRYNFACVCQRIGLRAPQKFNRHGRGPRIHDLRHTFAARTLVNWYRLGLDTGREMIKLSTYLGHLKPEHTYWYIEAVPELLELASERASALSGAGGTIMNTATLPTLLQQFFTDRLCTQMQASPNTIAGYRDTFRLLLRFGSKRLSKPPTKLRIEELDADLVGDFLTHIETARHNSARSRNTRLAAIRSFFRFVAMNEPASMLHCQRILAMPSKRCVRRAIDFLDHGEMEALLAAPDRATWVGRRDHAILLLAVQTGLRVSELVNLRCQDFVPGTGAHIRCEGKGRKQRCTPLRRETVKTLDAWLKERAGSDSDPLFPSLRGDRLSRDAIEHIVRKHTLSAARSCASLTGKRVSPHVFRHSTAMELLQNGVDQSVIALWLGHESVETTQVYYAHRNVM